MDVFRVCGIEGNVIVHQLCFISVIRTCVSSEQEARNRGDADMLEVAHANVTLGREIGKGAFGRVFIARADNICGRLGSQMVAVKQLKSE